MHLISKSYIRCVLVNLQQTSPSPACPGDDITLTCTMTGSYPTLTWINPQSTLDRLSYTFISVLYQDGTVGAFTTKLISSGRKVVSTATLTGARLQEHGRQGITCRYNDIIRTVYITLSGYAMYINMQYMKFFASRWSNFSH